MMLMSDFATGLQHIGIPTNDIKKTETFYTRLGFEVAHRTKDNENDVIFLRLGDLMIETYENHQAVGIAGAIDHIAINVTDIDAAKKIVIDLGLEIIEEGQLDFWENGVKYFIFPGLNQERLECNQYL